MHGLSTRAQNMIEFRKGLIIFDNYNSFPHLRTGRQKLKVLMRSKLRRYKHITQNRFTLWFNVHDGVTPTALRLVQQYYLN